MKDGKEESLTWGDVLLGTLLFPYLLSIPYESKEEEKDEKKEPENQQPAAPEEAPDNIAHVSCEKEQPYEKPKEHDDGCDDVPEHKDESREEEEYKDYFLSEYGGPDCGDCFLHNVLKNNSHDDYCALTKFIRDALVDLESGSDELGWEYNPNKSVVELKIDDHTEVTSQSATLFNCRAAETDMPVSIERRRDNEYYLVVELQ